MRDILSEIVTSKRLEVDRISPICERDDWFSQARDLPAPPDFRAALTGFESMRVIAEIKKASPSVGVIRQDFDPVAIAKSYEQAGAAALSVLTDEPFFQGKLEYLSRVRVAVKLPLLRKDFIIAPEQVAEARCAGASAVLLIAECLTPTQLADLVGMIQSLQMTPLVELYEPENLPAVLASGTPLVGINNRDLRTFHVDLQQTVRLIPQIPSDRIIVSESGIKSRADLLMLHRAGVHAVLIGESFMRHPDPGEPLRAFLSL